MKLSKSLLSPARGARDHPAALSSSLSRRLRHNGSLKGGASPFFPTAGKKRGCAGFDNPEPSSPKVTCIGQVRVKTKKKVKHTRSLSKRRAAGEVSFRKIDGDYAAAPPPPEHRNQRWVHLPISICEALRTFGEEFSCLFPCRSSCFSTSESEREKSEKHRSDGNNGENGCGAVFARWLVAVNDGEGGRRRSIELVVGGEDDEEEEEEERRVSMRSSRRHVLEDFELRDDDRIEMKGGSLEREEEEEAARVSICIPPKNALLLMRCRSDPMKMAALANRFSWDADAVAKAANEEIVTEYSAPARDDVGRDEEVEEEILIEEEVKEKKEIEVGVEEEEEEKLEMEEQVEEEELGESSEELVEEKTDLEMLFEEAMAVVEEGECREEEEEQQQQQEEEEEEVESNMSSFEALLDQENAEQYEDCCPIEEEDEEAHEIEIHSPICHLSPSTQSEKQEEEEEEEAVESKEELLLLQEEEEDEGNSAAAVEEKEESQESEDLSKNGEEEKKEKEKPMLPECLLLMMCEPKLSMEVSRETWVCSTDFTRWLPERPRRSVRAAKSGEPMKRRLSIDSKLKPIAAEKGEPLPPRSSCTLPAAAAASMAAMIEQKLVNAAAYEPFVLTRCKSEPMRTAAAKLAPESCFWKNAVRKLEPHAAMGVGAAGVGF